MELSVKQIMQAKDMFLKNEKCLVSFFIIIFCLFTNKGFSITDDKTKALNYLNSLKNFSASFLQNDGAVSYTHLTLPTIE